MLAEKLKGNSKKEWVSKYFEKFCELKSFRAVKKLKKDVREAKVHFHHLNHNIPTAADCKWLTHRNYQSGKFGFWATKGRKSDNPASANENFGQIFMFHPIQFGNFYMMSVENESEESFVSGKKWKNTKIVSREMKSIEQIRTSMAWTDFATIINSINWSSFFPLQ